MLRTEQCQWLAMRPRRSGTFSIGRGCGKVEWAKWELLIVGVYKQPWPSGSDYAEEKRVCRARCLWESKG